MVLQVLELLGSSNRRLVEAAAVMMSHAGSAMRPRLAGQAQLLSLASERLLSLSKSDSLRGAKASVRQACALHTSCAEPSVEAQCMKAADAATV